MFVLLYKLILLVALDNRDFAYWLISNKNGINQFHAGLLTEKMHAFGCRFFKKTDMK